MKTTILDFLVSCSLITAICSLISLVILCRHSLKRPNKNNNKTNCLQIAFHFLQPRVSFYFWEMFTFIFPNMVPPSLNLSCHLLSPPIRPPIRPIVNSCPLSKELQHPLSFFQSSFPLSIDLAMNVVLLNSASLSLDFGQRKSAIFHAFSHYFDTPNIENFSIATSEYNAL